MPRRLLSRSAALPALAALFLPLTGCGDDTLAASSGSSSPTTPDAGAAADAGTVDDIMTALPSSCAFECSGCTEPDTAFVCPTVAPWDTLPHADACGTWDGKPPAPVTGQCTASEPVGDAAAKTGPIAGGLILPDGHRIKPAGREVVFQEADLAGGFPMSILPLTGTRFALVSDGGIQDNALRLVDLDLLAQMGATNNPVAGYVRFPQPTSLFYGMAWLPPDRALASGGGDAVVYAFDVDTKAGTLARAPSRDIKVGTGGPMGTWYVGPIAATADGKRLLVAPSEHAEEIVAFSLAAADYGATLLSIPIPGSRAVFDLRLDPFDPSGTLFYATDQSKSRLLEIDGASGKIARTVALGKNPTNIAFLDATYLVVAEADGDALAVVNRATGVVDAHVPVFEKDAPHGFSPNSLAYHAASKRLYTTLAGVNAVEAYDVGPGTPPVITPAGRVPTAWWPTSMMVRDDGSIVVTNGKGHGVGTDDKHYKWGDGPITTRMRGSVQLVSGEALGSLTASTAAVEANRRVDQLVGRSEPQCPASTYDFPIPKDTTSGPSGQIKHVILVVRENKTYDAVFGDRKDLGDGDPTLIMASDTVLQSQVWANARAIAHGFSNFDNFYTDAEQSIQGHTWTVYGRTTDYMERTWLNIWGRGTRPIATPTIAIDGPKEGGVFAWLTDQGIAWDNMGEIIGNAAPDVHYPGLFYAQNLPDIDKSCYLGGRIRLVCDLKPFTYALQTNDHTYGASAGSAAPEVMIAVNDEAIGILLDALSHSPTWKDSLLIVTEDDPQDGGDHVDLHRSLLFMASPWVRRGYVSHGHYDMASVYRLVAHVFGVPYHNEMIRNAMVPYDVFTSTPDYTPYVYTPRSVAAPCNPGGTKEAKIASGWDFEDLDDQPGLSEQIMRMMKQPRAERGIRVTAPQAPPGAHR